MSELLQTPMMTEKKAAPVKRLPRLGFLGLGWIGCNRLEGVVRSEVADVCAVTDCSTGAVKNGLDLAPDAVAVGGLNDLLDLNLDGIVIATPSALHAEQSIAALERGCAVFCQKPLARDAVETRRVIEAARKADRLLGIDFCYRHTSGMQAIRRLIREGRLGSIYGVELVFHNAYGPDKLWFYDPKLSGGGCLIDLGTHLVDLALWTLDFPRVERAAGQLVADGMSLKQRSKNECAQVEDYAAVQLQLSNGAAVQFSCSWKAPAGCDARIEATFFGTKGGASFRNVDGSFYHFVAEHFLPDRTRALLAEPPDDWGGRAISAWARRLTQTPVFDPEIEHVTELAATLDHIYKHFT